MECLQQPPANPMGMHAMAGKPKTKKQHDLYRPSCLKEIAFLHVDIPDLVSAAVCVADARITPCSHEENDICFFHHHQK